MVRFSDEGNRCEKSCDALPEDRETHVAPLKRPTSDVHPVAWPRKRETRRVCIRFMNSINKGIVM